ncbi:hypothetical protein B0H14DRAFT_3634493 [Mycena olivaceomarginata]|nr:hypothetical protein B0H14DRAFT_3634493 [Mycena olivaceomarginata]
MAGPAVPPPPTEDLIVTNFAVAFAEEFFLGIVPGTRSYQKKHVFKWPITDVTAEDRLLVVIRATRKAGFPTIGSFLAALFDRRYNRHNSVYTSVASFLRGAEENPAHHPVAIVNLIFHHVKSQRWKAGSRRSPPSHCLDMHFGPPFAWAPPLSLLVPIAHGMR